MSIIIFIIILAVLILVHEFGHFIVAKKSGIRVDEFGLGFPPKIWSKKWNGTLYTLNAIPFGGFVKIFGEDAHTGNISEADRPTSFVYKPKYIQAAVLVAGVTMNVIFAWFLISLGFMIGLPSPVEHTGLGTVKNAELMITEVAPLSPAEKAGLKSGDVILGMSSGQNKIEGTDVTPENVRKIISESTGNIKLEYKRNDSSSKSVEITPVEFDDSLNRKIIGIAMDQIGTLQLPVHLALVEGVHTTYLLTKATATGLFEFLRNIFIFKADFSQVTGPIGIAGVVSDARAVSFANLLTLVALISINLALINLLPFPALDGGRLLFVLIEAIIRRPINAKVVQWINMIGFGLLLLLMVVVTGHDILKLL